MSVEASRNRNVVRLPGAVMEGRPALAPTVIVSSLHRPNATVLSLTVVPVLPTQTAFMKMPLETDDSRLPKTQNSDSRVRLDVRNINRTTGENSRRLTTIVIIEKNIANSVANGRDLAKVPLTVRLLAILANDAVRTTIDKLTKLILVRRNVSVAIS